MQPVGMELPQSRAERREQISQGRVSGSGDPRRGPYGTVAHHVARHADGANLEVADFTPFTTDVVMSLEGRDEASG